MATLNINDVTLSFGGLNALSEVSLTIEPGLITSIIGPSPVKTAGRDRWFFRIILAAMCQHIDAWLIHAADRLT